MGMRDMDKPHPDQPLIALELALLLLLATLWGEAG